VAIPYEKKDLFRLEDFVDKATGVYNVQFTHNRSYPVGNVILSFKQGAGTYVKELDFSTAISPETKELSFSGLPLEEIKITYKGGQEYTVKFKP